MHLFSQLKLMHKALLGSELSLQRNIYIIEFGLSDPSFSVRRVGNQITIKVIFNNLHYPLHTQRSERKYY